MSRLTHLDVTLVKAQIAKLRSEHPELAEDLALLEDTIEGETEMHRVAEKVLEMFLDAVSMEGAVENRIFELKKRGTRYHHSAEGCRAVLLSLLAAAGLPTLRLSQATVSQRQGAERVAIDDATQLPQGFFRTETVPLINEIGKALKAGEDVPGAHLERGPTSLSIRTA